VFLLSRGSTGVQFPWSASLATVTGAKAERL
jgi:hypothetical protein